MPDTACLCYDCQHKYRTNTEKCPSCSQRGHFFTREGLVDFAVSDNFADYFKSRGLMHGYIEPRASSEHSSKETELIAFLKDNRISIDELTQTIESLHEDLMRRSPAIRKQFEPQVAQATAAIRKAPATNIETPQKPSDKSKPPVSESSGPFEDKPGSEPHKKTIFQQQTES